MDSFRRWGYLQADLDPLEHFAPLPHPELEYSGEEAEAARRIYAAASASNSCTSPIPSGATGSRSAWNREQQEPVDRARVLDQLVRADVFEQTIHSRYIGTKRYSLEGNTALIPLLDEILNSASSNGAEQAVLAMSHRGRLNVIINIVSRPAAEVFAGFEDVDPRSVLGGGDVKYHIGATGIFTGCQRQAGPHPSGVQSQPPGSGESRRHGPRARQADPHRPRRQSSRVLPIIMHGDAAFAGQGITAETPEPCHSARLQRRRNGSHYRQQLDRFHRQSQRSLFRPFLVGSSPSACRFRSFMSTARMLTQ